MGVDVILIDVVSFTPFIYGLYRLSSLFCYRHSYPWYVLIVSFVCVYRSYRLYELREIDTLTEALQLAAQDVARYRTMRMAMLHRL